MRPGSVMAFIAVGLGAGVAVTRHAHRVPASPWWDRRAGRSRLRRSDLPVGGTAALLAAAVLRGTGQRRAAQAAAALGIGAAAGALATGFLEPLPRTRGTQLFDDRSARGGGKPSAGERVRRADRR